MAKTILQAAVGLVVMGIVVPAWSAEAVIDDFESYNDKEVIGSSWDSSPWRRFGEATEDNVIATKAKSKVISGKASAVYSVSWPRKFGCALRVLDQPTDLSQHQAVSFKIRSNEPATLTVVRLSVTDGSSTYLSKERFLLSDQVQNVSFSLSGDAMELVDGAGAYDDVAANATAIGFQLQSTTSRDQGYIEMIIFDDLSFSDTTTVKAE